MGKQIRVIQLTETEKNYLITIVNKRTSPQQMVLRAKIILMTSNGDSVSDIMKKLDTTKVTISKWKNRFLKKGLDGLSDLNRPGRALKYGPEIRHKLQQKLVILLPAELIGLSVNWLTI